MNGVVTPLFFLEFSVYEVFGFEQVVAIHICNITKFINVLATMIIWGFYAEGKNEIILCTKRN